MNVLFLSISSLPHISEHSISLDLIHEFQRNGHKVFVVCAIEKRDNGNTNLTEEAGCSVLRVKIGNNKKAGIIEKGITTLGLPYFYISAIKKYYADVKFDLVLYPTPPVTQVKTVKFIKKRDHASSYLLLKDIFPQNALDIGMMTKNGPKGLLYKYFRNQEKELYAISDHIGCMSQANVDYVLKNNPEVNPKKVEVCPNSIEYIDTSLSESDRLDMRSKYGLPIDKKIFVYGGNLGKPQGIPFLIDCLRTEKDNKDAFFLIVGDGTEYEKLHSFISDEKPQNVKLMKRLPKEDYDRLVAACDVGMIFLDHRFTIPNFPSRLLSYMQAGLPVLACTDPNTDIGKVIEEGKFGWWCESNSIEEFIAICEKIIQIESFEDLHKNAVTYLMKYYESAKSYEIIQNQVD
jgi:hypothetical protein